MDIQEIKVAKVQCTSEIKAILIMFEKQTECIVESIWLNHDPVNHGDWPLNIVIDVKV